MRCALMVALIWLLPAAARAELAYPETGGCSAARPVPKLVAPPGLSVEAAWVAFPGSACKNVLQVSVGGHFYIGALQNLVRVGKICPAFQGGSSSRLTATFYRLFPKDGDAVEVHYGATSQCESRDSFGPFAAGFEGSCIGARETGPTSRYSTVLQVGKDGARVRSTAVFAADEANLLGKLPPKTTVYAEGPLKNGDFSAGVGWAVLIADAEHHVCRGYLSESVLQHS